VWRGGAGNCPLYRDRQLEESDVHEFDAKIL